MKFKHDSIELLLVDFCKAKSSGIMEIERFKAFWKPLDYWFQVTGDSIYMRLPALLLPWSHYISVFKKKYNFALKQRMESSLSDTCQPEITIDKIILIVTEPQTTWQAVLCGWSDKREPCKLKNCRKPWMSC